MHFLIGLIFSVWMAVSASAQDSFAVGQRAFNQLTLENRILFQISMTAAGFWPSVPNVTYSRRLHQSIREFQGSLNEAPTGVITVPQVERLMERATVIMKGWGLRSVVHPERGRALWVPFGLDLSAGKTANGVLIKDPKNSIRLAYSYFAGTDLRAGFEGRLTEMVAAGDVIDYQLLRDDFFVIAASKGAFKRYSRYHRDGNGLLGFDFWWSKESAPVYGDRLVTLISGSFWASMTGSPYMTVARVSYPWENEPKVASNPQVASAPASPQAAHVPSPAAPPTPKKATISAGSGFFVSKAGHILTNAHVVEGCSSVTIKADGQTSGTGSVFARDAQNDLALIKIANSPATTLPVRSGARLGEGVAAFGFPHSDMLATSGNFTLGNVTALAGLGNDTRFLQVSAPVQSGNSGGPLLDNHGNLIGIVTSKLNAAKVMASSGDLPQNVNFAVRSSLAMGFLDANGVSYEIGTNSSPKLEPADLADRAKQASVFVVCVPSSN